MAKTIRDIFDQRLLGGEVSSGTFRKFNKLRFELMGSKPEYEKYLKSKSCAVRMFVHVFLTFPDTMLELANKADIEDENNGKPDAE